MTVSLLVPFTPGDSARDRNWAWVRARYERLMPDWEIVVAPDPGPGEWSKGRALAAAAEAATGEMFVIADADVMVGPGVLESAVDAVDAGAPWVVPHLGVYRLNPKRTQDLLAGHLGDDPHDLPRRDLFRSRYDGVPGGGLVVLPGETFTAVGGMDPAFRGWGGDDLSFACALDTLAGPHVRHPAAPLWHLWHQPQVRTRRNNARMSRYSTARGDPDAMRTLIAEEHP